ncbi:MAG TPA: enoyl-CoA hydratase [Vicinamibacterales bacterium]|nr:enoyl-CoA hydratase [Vicinamibacterales bacterium]
MPSSNVVWDIEGSIGTLTFNRPQARNALTWDMYDALMDTCELVDTSDVRVLVIRGAGAAFAAGTDITQFRDFATGADGVAYERRLDTVIDRLERVNRITIAAVNGPAVGGGCAIALACDLRICSDRARFGVPVARTLGNCLSAANLARLVDLLGPARALDLLLTARLVDADEALRVGLATRVVPPASLDAEVARLAEELTHRASSTVTATKTVLRRIREQRRPAQADDVVAACYASAEFRQGVAAFLDGSKPTWE